MPKTYQIARQIAQLGTETAYAVAARANQHAALGNKVYPLHLGDLNIPTAPHIVEATLKAIRDGKTGYCAPAGIPPLREALAHDANLLRGTKYTLDNVSVQPGGKPVIGKFLMALMNPGDSVLCPSPGYPIYASQIEYLGGVVAPYGFKDDGEAFRIDFDALEKAILPSTQLIIINDFHNPTGASCTAEERRRLAEFCCKHDLIVLLDEAYIEMQFGTPSDSLVMEDGMLERSVILYTFSKKFAMTGWRLGAAIGPQPIIDVISRLNVNAESCTAHFVQYGGLAGLTEASDEPKKIITVLKERCDVGVALLNQAQGVTCTRPTASFFLFPEVTELMARKGFGMDYDAFAEDILVRTGVSLCTRKHFGNPSPDEDKAYVRIAFSGIDTPVLEEGLKLFVKYAAQ